MTTGGSTCGNRYCYVHGLDELAGGEPDARLRCRCDRTCPCWRRATQEDLLCDVCRVGCNAIVQCVTRSDGVHVRLQTANGVVLEWLMPDVTPAGVVGTVLRTL